MSYLIDKLKIVIFFETTGWNVFVWKACFNKDKNKSSNRTQDVHCYQNSNRQQNVFQHFLKPVLTYGHRQVASAKSVITR